MAGTGGKREGAGRKPGSRGHNTKLAEQLKTAFIKEYNKHRKTIWEALLTKAEEGDVPAIKEANERAMGKVPAPLITSDDEGNVLPFQIIITKLNAEGKD